MCMGVAGVSGELSSDGFAKFSYGSVTNQGKLTVFLNIFLRNEAGGVSLIGATQK
jgi:hypothetical protein